MTVAVIAARGGSKRIPRKNIRPFAGVPLIVHPIRTALEAFGRVIVSTDDAEIAAVAQAAGAEVPFLRPASLADDHTPVGAAAAHAIEALDLRDDWVCLVYATAALLDPATLKAAQGQLETLPEHVDFLVSVATYPHPVQRALERAADGCLRLRDPAQAAVRTQDLPESYYDGGQFAFGRRLAWQRTPAYWSGIVAGSVLDRWSVVDIDTEEDWRMAERLWAARTISPGTAEADH